MSRPSDFTGEIAEEICALIAEGESLRKICERDDMPNRRTVLRWLTAHEDFAAKHARAREMQADVMDEKIMDAADACTAENAQAQRVKIAAYQWRAAKLKPKVYGEKTQTEITGADGKPVAVEYRWASEGDQ